MRIELLDVLEKTLATLLQAERPSGENNEPLTLPEGLARGLYLLNIQTALGNRVVKINISKFW